MDINREKDSSEIYTTLSMLRGGNENIIKFIIGQINNVTAMKTHLTIRQYETDGFVINMKGFGNKENNVKTIGYYAVIDKDSYHIISYLIIAIKYFDIHTLNNNVNLRFIFAFSSMKISLLINQNVLIILIIFTIFHPQFNLSLELSIKNLIA